MKITIDIIEPGQHRPGITGADWQYDIASHTVNVRITRMSDWKREACLIIHELVEALCCMAERVTWESVDNFDAWFDKTYPNKLNTEAGDHADAPYRSQHSLATGIERIMCERFGISWRDYDDEIARLG